jgi:hypothetical protein
VADLPNHVELIIPSEIAPGSRDFHWMETRGAWGLGGTSSLYFNAAETAQRLRDLADRIEAHAQGPDPK